MTVRQPQKFHSAEYSQIEDLVNLEGTVFEQKCDGIRALVVITPSGVTYHTHGGRPLRSSAAAQWFNKITAQVQRLYSPSFKNFEVVLDGEIMIEDGHLHLFDMPFLSIDDNLLEPSAPFSYRRAYLESVFATLQATGADGISVVRQARTIEEKRELAQAVFDSNGEGVMCKHLDSPYNEGERVKHSLKCKFVRTADVVVTARNVGESTGAKGGDKENAEFAVYDALTGALKPMGRCSMIGKPDAQPGDVIEVDYLFVGTGGVLYQPRCMRLRTDKTAPECTTDQFKTYSKAVLA